MRAAVAALCLFSPPHWWSPPPLIFSPLVLPAGDDDGHVRLWDTRTRARTGTFRMHEDFVADLHVHSGRHALLTVSGDGTLTHLDLRTQTVVARSDAQEDELLCGARLLP